MTRKEKKKRRKELLQELDDITRVYNEIYHRAPQVISYYDDLIEKIVQLLKDLGGN
ncbi:hypothetical protein AB4865_07315 [Capnocytophaga sp. ARDL2]|uniref:hypothetical protein n=1 Tax=Capnocytophaga sp. ARDL2 TaxID=3238809 RepID=UPI003558E118